MAALPVERSTAQAPVGPVTYRVVAFPGGLRELRGRFSSSQLDLLEKLNRVDLDHLGRLTHVVVPEAWNTTDLEHSPLPLTYAWAESHEKVLVVHQPTQVFAAYERGRLARWGPVSSGRKESQTPPGVFHLNWRSKGRHSTVNPEWFMRWYFNFGCAQGLSFHEYALPGQPASHSCIRLLARDARWLYDWGEEWRLDATERQVLTPGTPVVVVGAYDFSAPPPWRSPGLLTRSVELPPDPHAMPGSCSLNPCSCSGT